MDIRVKRVYEAPSPDDGTRVLVDRLWPRGLSKDKARVDLWLKELAPSTALRKWFNHEPAKWEEFQQRYGQELRLQPAALERLGDLIDNGPVTLLFGAKEERFNDAVALKAFLLAREKPSPHVRANHTKAGS
jgi:uncharacterized protein YeaO (DUF488 family)